MSKGPEIDAAAARKVVDACSEFKLPKAPEVGTDTLLAMHAPAISIPSRSMPPPPGGTLPQEELRNLSREEWMARFGGTLQSEQHFEKRSPAWNYDQKSWWVGPHPGCSPGLLYAVCSSELGRPVW